MTAAWEQRIELKLDELLTVSARMAEAGEARQRMLDDHSRTLYGNGSPGLKDRVLAIEARASQSSLDVSSLKRTCDANHKSGVWSKVWPTVLAGLILTTIVTVAAFALGVWQMHAIIPK